MAFAQNGKANEKLGERLLDLGNLTLIALAISQVVEVAPDIRIFAAGLVLFSLFYLLGYAILSSNRRKETA